LSGKEEPRTADSSVFAEIERGKMKYLLARGGPEAVVGFGQGDGGFCQVAERDAAAGE